MIFPLEPLDFPEDLLLDFPEDLLLDFDEEPPLVEGSLQPLA